MRSRETEAGFMAAVRELAAMTGWRCYHTLRSAGSAAGFPDLVLCRGERLIFAELKAERGRVSAVQEEWLRALRAVAEFNPSVEVYLWRPSDWEAIERALAARAGARPLGAP